MTSKQRINTPFSTISYNSEPFLQTVLNELVSDGVLKFASYIKHKAEKDEAKDHCHVYFEPNGALDPQKLLMEQFSEFDPTHPNKPLACLPFRRSKTDDWILYGMHHAEYLWMKERQTREFHYKIEQFWSTSPDYLRELYNNINWSFMDNVVIIDSFKSEEQMQDLIHQGVINVRNAVGVKALYSLLNRNYRETHTPKTTKDNYYVDDDGVKDTRLKAENPPTTLF